ncbi:SpoIIE family protein phosphatase [Marinomonas sp. TW1]|uniref:SpoIIE family protein phosphatase n=1 Tax=Marinomonas sp. TW1 TaxID=1561203 RepID=UPI0007AFA42E|nr:SpoIIE family protein phosphatase [Marinomonas sp. TW1]KZN13193.1 histidine kinase [Marinomonas sp. TW1]
MKLLCIDSEPVYRDILTLCAEREGLNVKTVASYHEAIDAFKDFVPDIVTLDVIIKGGNGLELVKKLKNLSGSRFVPMLFLASHTSDSVMDQCFHSGADDFLPKPFDEMLFNIRLKTHMRHVALVKEMYKKNKALTFFQTMIEREHEMAHQVLDHIQTRSEKNSDQVVITRIAAASFNGDLALVKTRADGARLAFVGDFTGHGLPASIGALPVMQTFFDAVDDLTSLSELAIKINKTLNSILPDYMFCAGYLILLSPDGHFNYWGGGMPDAMIRRSSGELDCLKSRHMPLGVQSTCEFDPSLERNQLKAGDTLVILSDGVLELKNTEGNMYGEEQVKALIKMSYGDKNLMRAQTRTERVLEEYLGDAVQLDDITLVALRTE